MGLSICSILQKFDRYKKGNKMNGAELIINIPQEKGPMPLTA